MKPPSRVMIILLLTVGPGALWAVDPAPTAGPAAAPAPPPAKLSPEVALQLTSVLPKFSPLAEPARAAAANPDAVELPKVTVTQKKRPRLGEDVMMSDKAFNEMLAKQKLNTFDRNFLNKFTLPLFGTSAASRAREEYEREKKAQFMSDIETIARATEAVDPTQAKELRDAAARP